MKKVYFTALTGIFTILGLSAQKEINVPTLNEESAVMYISSTLQGKTCFSIEDGGTASLYVEVDFTKEKTMNAYSHCLANSLNQFKKQGYKLIGTTTTGSIGAYLFQKN